MSDIRVPASAVFYFVLFGDGVTELGTCRAVEAKVRFFIPVLGSIGVGWDVAVFVNKVLFGRPGREDTRCGEGTKNGAL